MPETRLDLDDAVRAILADTQPQADSEQVAGDRALGRILADDVHAPVSLPPFPASAMDGYALNSRDAQGAPPHILEMVGTSYAGRPWRQPVPRGACVRIFTGAVVPDGLDAVAIQEDCDRDGERLVIREAVSPGDNVRPAGHDVTVGTRILPGGRALNPFDLAWLAACGITRVTVRRPITVGLFSTGDELKEPGETLGDGSIFDANRTVLRALLADTPVTIRDYGILADQPDTIRDVLKEADASCHAIVTSGGVSVGDADHVREVVEQLGTLKLWRLNLKPGKPVAYGRLKRAAFFGLPGNPVSTIVTAMMLVKPALQRLCGGIPAPPLAVPAILQQAVRHSQGREEFQRGTLMRKGDSLTVTVTGDQSSNRLASFAAANCLIRIPKSCGDLLQGSVVDVLPFRGAL